MNWEDFCVYWRQRAEAAERERDEARRIAAKLAQCTTAHPRDPKVERARSWDCGGRAMSEDADGTLHDPVGPATVRSLGSKPVRWNRAPSVPKHGRSTTMETHEITMDTTKVALQRLGLALLLSGARVRSMQSLRPREQWGRGVSVTFLLDVDSHKLATVREHLGRSLIHVGPPAQAKPA